MSLRQPLRQPLMLRLSESQRFLCVEGRYVELLPVKGLVRECELLRRDFDAAFCGA